MNSEQSDDPRLASLLHILRVTSTSSAKIVTYTAALLGIVALVPDIQLPPEIGIIAGGIGVEAISHILELVASRKDMSNEEIAQRVEEAIADNGINLLSKEEFFNAFILLRKGQKSLLKQNRDIFDALKSLDFQFKDSAWDSTQFEQEIVDLYTAMGYETHQHFPISGQEIKFLAARRMPGGGLYRMIVECIHKGSEILADSDDLQSTIATFNIARVTNEAVACTIVTTNGFTASAQRVAQDSGIYLTTRRQLVKGLIDFSPYLRKLKTNYLKDFYQGEVSWYISTNGRIGKEQIGSLETFVDKWLSNELKNPLALLGGYGTGKTSFCRHYAVHIIDKMENLIPIIIPLRNFQKQIKIESVIRDFLDEECNASAPRFETFYRMYNEGLLLLLFDGFDEMAKRLNTSVIEANLMEIEKFSSKVGNVILTCRPEYFISSKEEEGAWQPSHDPLSDRLTIYEPIEIELWEEEQIVQYVKKRLYGISPSPTHPPDFYIDRIRNLPELRDMSVRAVHLDLIVKVLPRMIEKNIHITRPNLYRTYIEGELRRETVQNKRLQVISDDARVALMQALAIERFLEAHDELDFEAASKIIQDKLNLPVSEVSGVTSDFLNRSFLQRNGDKYRFAHKSLGEYLVAAELQKRIRNDSFSLSIHTKYSSAVAGLVLEMFGGIDAFDDMLRALKIDRESHELTYDDLPSMAFAGASLEDHCSNLMFLSKQAQSRQKEQLEYTLMKVDILTHDTLNILYTLRNEFLREQLDNEQLRRKTNLDRLDRMRQVWTHILYRLKELQRFKINRFTYNIEYQTKKTWVNLLKLVQLSIIIIPEEQVQVIGEPISFYGDEDQLLRVFENIVSNAKYAMGQDDRLTVEIYEGNDTNWVRVVFTNTGSQIPEEIKDKIFERGFTTKKDGFGLGLAIVEELVQLHGGYITVNSNPQKTSFEIFLPRS